jgi:hypothetical protein
MPLGKVFYMRYLLTLLDKEFVLFRFFTKSAGEFITL